jgi:hypothetical protein
MATKSVTYDNLYKIFIHIQPAIQINWKLGILSNVIYRSFSANGMRVKSLKIVLTLDHN